MPVFASNWSSLMSISSNKSSQARKAFAPSKGCGNIWGGVSTRVCGACDARRERMGRIRSARALQLLMPLTGERFPGVSEGEYAPAAKSGVEISTRESGADAVGLGQSGGARWRAGAHPRPRQQSLEGVGGRRPSSAFALLQALSRQNEDGRRQFVPMLRVRAVTTLITDKVCSASRLAADITFFTSHVDPFKVVRLSEFKSKKSMTMRENSARTCRTYEKSVFTPLCTVRT